MSCYGCPLRPALLERIEAQKLQQYAEIDVAYETLNIMRQAEAEALMESQPPDGEYVGERDRLKLKLMAQLLESNTLFDRADYITRRSDALLAYIDNPEYKALQEEDAACNGPAQRRTTMFVGKKVMSCALSERLDRALALGIRADNG